MTYLDITNEIIRLNFIAKALMEIPKDKYSKDEIALALRDTQRRAKEYVMMLVHGEYTEDE